MPGKDSTIPGPMGSAGKDARDPIDGLNSSDVSRVVIQTLKDFGFKYNYEEILNKVESELNQLEAHVTAVNKPSVNKAVRNIKEIIR